MQKKNELKFDTLKMEKISTSKEGIGMYAITFTIGNEKHSVTRHLTEAQAKSYVPAVKTVYSGERSLQKSCFNVKDLK